MKKINEEYKDLETLYHKEYTKTEEYKKSITDIHSMDIESFIESLRLSGMSDDELQRVRKEISK